MPMQINLVSTKSSTFFERISTLLITLILTSSSDLQQHLADLATFAVDPILRRGEYDDVLDEAIGSSKAQGAIATSGSSAGSLAAGVGAHLSDIIHSDFGRLHRIDDGLDADSTGIMSALQSLIRATTATLPRQCATAGFLFATGDVIAQQVVERRGKQHDLIRTARLATYGGLIFSPIAAFWLGKVLERVPYKGFAGTVAKVGLDQSIAAPVLLGVFFTSTTLMEGKGINDVKAKLKQSYWSTLLTSWSVWIPVQTINMAFVPPTQRLLFINVVSIFWNTFLALVAGGSGAPAKPSTPIDEYGLRERIPAAGAVSDAVSNTVDKVKGAKAGSMAPFQGASASKLATLLPFSHQPAQVPHVSSSKDARSLPAGPDVAAALREIKAHKVW